MSKRIELNEEELEYLVGLINHKLRLATIEYEQMVKSAKDYTGKKEEDHSKLRESQLQFKSLLRGIYTKMVK